MVDALAFIIQLIQTSVRVRSPRTALVYLSRTRLRTLSHADRDLSTGMVPSGVQNLDTEILAPAPTTTEPASSTRSTLSRIKYLLENDIFRSLPYVFGVLPQVLKLYTYSGILGIQVLAFLYLISWFVLDVVIITARFKLRSSSTVMSPELAYISSVDTLVIWTCCYTINFSDVIATLIYISQPVPLSRER